MFPGKKGRVCLLLVGVIAVSPTAVLAQVVGPLGGLGSPIGPVGAVGPINVPPNAAGGLSQLPSVTAGVGRAIDSVSDGLLPSLASTVDSAGRPIDQRLMDFSSGVKVVRDEVLVIEPTASDLAAAQGLKFEVLQTDRLGALDLEAVSLRIPSGMSAARALAALRTADPSGNFDLDHIYDPTGSDSTGLPAVVSSAMAAVPPGIVVGMIDAGIDKHHPALAHDEIIAGNVTGTAEAPATAHGTAVASLLVGQDRDFHGQLPGATLYAADVFGGAATGGSALDIARALDWLAQNKVVVVNASLAGPPNGLLAAAVKSFISKGHVLVAAAGNAGPAAPPAYPAAYDGVIGVTSVDANRHLQMDANRGNVSFAALGVSVRAATLKSGYDTFTGTSFAAPVVTAQFAVMVRAPDADAARNASQRLAKSAIRLGEQSAYGYGFVGAVGSIAAQ